MIIQTTLQDGRIYTYSSEGYKILQNETNILYNDAVDINPCPYTYAETDEIIPPQESSVDEILNILLGGEQV